MTAQTQIETLSAIARQCLDECDGDKAKAAIAVDALLKSNLDLRAIVAAEAVGKLIKAETHFAHLANRAQIARTADLEGPARVAALASGLYRGLLDFPLMDGRPLRLADRETLDLSIDDYRSRSKTMAQRADWLSAIRMRLPEKAIVGDVLTDDDVQVLWEKTK